MRTEAFILFVLGTVLVLLVGLYVVSTSSFDLADVLCWLELGACTA